MKLWDYLQVNMSRFDEKNDEEQEREEKEKLIEIFNELFLLDYIAMNHLEDNETEITEKITNKADEDRVLIIESTPFGEDIDKVEINQIIKREFRKEVLEKQIRDIFDKYFKKYMKNIESEN